jgi:hypothetical protein
MLVCKDTYVSILLVNVFLNLGWLLYTYTAPQREFIPCRRKRPMRWEKGGGE